MWIHLNARIITPLVMLNFLSLEDYIITRLKEQTRYFTRLKHDYFHSTEKYSIPDVITPKSEVITPATNAVETTVTTTSETPKQTGNLNEIISDSIQKVDEAAPTYVAALKLAHFRSLVYNNLHENLPIIYPLLTIGTFFAPILMTRACEMFIYGRFAFFIYDLYTLKTSGQVSTRSDDLTFGISSLLLFGLIGFTSVVPFYRFLGHNANAIKLSAQRDMMLAEQAKQRLANLK